MNELVPFAGSQAVGSSASRIVVPAIIADAGAQATRRFLEFFAATIRNKNTRMAYYRAVVGMRDRALISVMTFTFARVGAAVDMRVDDYYPQGKRWWVRLHEKGGKRHEMPAHHTLEAYLDAYLDAAGLRDSGKSPLFRSA